MYIAMHASSDKDKALLDRQTVRTLGFDVVRP